MADLKISQFVDGGTIQISDEIATNRGGVNVKAYIGSAGSLNIGLAPGDISVNSMFGTASRLDVGDDIGQIPIFNDDGSGNSQYPAGDGSLITGVVGTGEVKIVGTDTELGFLEDKIIVGVGLTKETVAPTGNAELSLDVRHKINVVTGQEDDTIILDIADGDFHEVTVTGLITLEASMDNAQAIIITAIDFDGNPPLNSFDWGIAGEPVWTEKDSFVVYRDNDGEYKASLIISGLE